jgi:hypothetical protein
MLALKGLVIMLLSKLIVGITIRFISIVFRHTVLIPYLDFYICGVIFLIFISLFIYYKPHIIVNLMNRVIVKLLYLCLSIVCSFLFPYLSLLVYLPLPLLWLDWFRYELYLLIIEDYLLWIRKTGSILEQHFISMFPDTNSSSESEGGGGGGGSGPESGQLLGYRSSSSDDEESNDSDAPNSPEPSADQVRATSSQQSSSRTGYRAIAPMPPKPWSATEYLDKAFRHQESGTTTVYPPTASSSNQPISQDLGNHQSSATSAGELPVIDYSTRQRLADTLRARAVEIGQTKIAEANSSKHIAANNIGGVRVTMWELGIDNKSPVFAELCRLFPKGSDMPPKGLPRSLYSDGYKNSVVWSTNPKDKNGTVSETFINLIRNG